MSKDKSAVTWLSRQGAATRGTRTGGTAEAVAGDRDRHVFQSRMIDLPQEERVVMPGVDAELLIEITIIDLAAPVNT